MKEVMAEINFEDGQYDVYVYDKETGKEEVDLTEYAFQNEKEALAHVENLKKKHAVANVKHLVEGEAVGDEEQDFEPSSDLNKLLRPDYVTYTYECPENFVEHLEELFVARYGYKAAFSVEFDSEYVSIRVDIMSERLKERIRYEFGDMEAFKRDILRTLYGSEGTHYTVPSGDFDAAIQIHVPFQERHQA